MRHVLLSVILVAILIAGCDATDEEDTDVTATNEPTEVVAEQESEDPTATEEEATEAADESEATAADTATSEPTATETPTPEPTATSTATPTPQPTATATPEPTATPAPTATPVPEPITYTGTGTNVIDIDKPGGPDSAALVYVSGNAADRHFAITSHDASGEQVDLLVNTTDPYEGVVPLDFFDDERTTRFQVDAEGSWHIEIRPLSSARATAAPGSISGVGDDVFVVDGTPDVAHVVGNAEGSHFAVIGYGGGYDLLVNTTDPYDGRVIVSSGSFVFEVTGAGNWEIIFE